MSSSIQYAIVCFLLLSMLALGIRGCVLLDKIHTQILVLQLELLSPSLKDTQPPNTRKHFDKYSMNIALTYTENFPAKETYPSGNNKVSYFGMPYQPANVDDLFRTIGQSTTTLPKRSLRNSQKEELSSVSWEEFPAGSLNMLISKTIQLWLLRIPLLEDLLILKHRSKDRGSSLP